MMRNGPCGRMGNTQTPSITCREIIGVRIALPGAGELKKGLGPGRIFQIYEEVRHTASLGLGL